MVVLTGFYAGILTLLYIYLIIRVVKLRWSEKVGLGVGESRKLLKAVRVHGNFAEYIPLALLLIALLELSLVWKPLIHFLGITLVISRLLHMNGLTKTSGSSRGRFLGTVTLSVCMIMSSLFLIFKFLAGAF